MYQRIRALSLRSLVGLVVESALPTLILVGSLSPGDTRRYRLGEVFFPVNITLINIKQQLTKTRLAFLCNWLEVVLIFVRSTVPQKMLRQAAARLGKAVFERPLGSLGEFQVSAHKAIM
eukprot:1194420-Prorocentrum_minimum.AAC.2